MYSEKGKLVIFSAPSGAGKTTLVRHLLEQDLGLSFSVSACTRPPRPGEINGRDYYFLNVEEFMEKIKNNEFVEWEEVYPDQYYGTLKSELQRIRDQGRHVIFDVDVAGGLKLKNRFKDSALAVFVKPSSFGELRERLRSRSSDTEQQIMTRIGKAASEMEYATRFDRILVNDRLDETLGEAYGMVSDFLKA